MKHFKMNFGQLCCVFCVLLALPMLANAEIYKWKDKDGVMRYTDTPPPSNVKQENIVGKKFIKPTGQPALSPVASKDSATGKEPNVKEPAAKGDTADEAAKLRQKNAETEKRNKQEKENQAKLNAENCKAAKSNLASYNQGGRVYKMNEKGEREYLDDAGLKAGAAAAQKDMAQYCNS
jgi:Domain of unknown function (DUF4124)